MLALVSFVCTECPGRIDEKHIKIFFYILCRKTALRLLLDESIKSLLFRCSILLAHWFDQSRNIVALNEWWLIMCNTMGVIRSCGCGCQSENLSVLTRFSHKGPSREISHESGSGREKEGPKEDRREQSAERIRRDQSTEQVSQEMRVRQRRDQSKEFRKAAARTCWPTDAGLANARRWVSIPVALWTFRANTRPW